MATVSSARVPATEAKGAPHPRLAVPDPDRDPVAGRPALDDPHRRPAHQLFREPAEQRTTRLVDRRSRTRSFTLDAYDRALTNASGGSLSMWDYFLNSMSITIPATLIPIGIAALAAYAFAWMRFPRPRLAVHPLRGAAGDPAAGGAGAAADALRRRWACSARVAGSGSPTRRSGCRSRSSCCTTTSSQLPRDLIEAARIDGATHWQIFRTDRAAAVGAGAASFAIFQFLWVWNDLPRGAGLRAGHRTSHRHDRQHRQHRRRPRAGPGAPAPRRRSSRWSCR